MNQNFSKFKQRIAGVTLLTTVLISTNANAEWSIYGLGTLGGTSSFAQDINNSGQVVGSSYMPGNAIARAFITGPNGSGMTAIEALGYWSRAHGINDIGQVTGFSPIDSSGEFVHAFITGPNGVGITDIGAMNKSYSSSYDASDSDYLEASLAVDINESGQVVGQDGLGYPYGGRADAFMTGPNGTGITRLPDIPEPSYSGASAINDSGQVVGTVSNTTYTRSDAFITGANGVGITFIDIPGDHDEVTSINNLGQVVGSYSGSGGHHAFVTGSNGIGITDLGNLGGNWSQASDINEFGKIIGSSMTADGSIHSFFFSDGKMIDLSILPEVVNAGFTNIRVTAINDHGQIVGTGNLDGYSQAFLLSPFPVPEPQTYAMLLAGLGLLGFMALRRKNLI